MSIKQISGNLFLKYFPSVCITGEMDLINQNLIHIKISEIDINICIKTNFWQSFFINLLSVYITGEMDLINQNLIQIKISEIDINSPCALKQISGNLFFKYFLSVCITGEMDLINQN